MNNLCKCLLLLLRILKRKNSERNILCMATFLFQKFTWPKLVKLLVKLMNVRFLFLFERFSFASSACVTHTELLCYFVTECYFYGAK